MIYRKRAHNDKAEAIFTIFQTVFKTHQLKEKKTLKSKCGFIHSKAFTTIIQLAHTRNLRWDKSKIYE